MSPSNDIDIPWLRPCETPTPAHTPPTTIAPPPSPIATPFAPQVTRATPPRAPSPPHRAQPLATPMAPATPTPAPHAPHHAPTPVTPDEARVICNDTLRFRLRPHSPATMDWRMSIRPHRLFAMGLNHGELLSMRWDQADKEEVRGWRDGLRAEGRAEDVDAVRDSVRRVAEYMAEATARAKEEREEREFAEAVRASLAEQRRAERVEEERSRKRQRSDCEAGPSGEGSSRRRFE